MSVYLDLFALSRLYEKRSAWTANGTNILCAGLYCLYPPNSIWTIVPGVSAVIAAIVMIVIGEAERVLPVPSEVLALGVARKRLEARHRFVERIAVTVMESVS